MVASGLTSLLCLDISWRDTLLEETLAREDKPLGTKVVYLLSSRIPTLRTLLQDRVEVGSYARRPRVSSGAARWIRWSAEENYGVLFERMHPDHPGGVPRRIIAFVPRELAERVRTAYRAATFDTRFDVEGEASNTCSCARSKTDLRLCCARSPLSAEHGPDIYVYVDLLLQVC